MRHLHLYAYRLTECWISTAEYIPNYLLQHQSHLIFQFSDQIKQPGFHHFVSLKSLIYTSIYLSYKPSLSKLKLTRCSLPNYLAVSCQIATHNHSSILAFDKFRFQSLRKKRYYSYNPAMQ